MTDVDLLTVIVGVWIAGVVTAFLYVFRAHTG